MSDLRLKGAERAAMFRARDGRGEWPNLHRDGKKPCPAKAGDRLELSSRLWIEVVEIRRARKGHHVIVYIPHYLEPERYLLPTSHTVPVDDDGNLVPVSDAEEHGYTTDPGRGLGGSRDAGAAVPARYQRELTLAARLRHANRGRQITG